MNFPEILFKARNLSFQVFKFFKFALQELGGQQCFFANAARCELIEVGGLLFRIWKIFNFHEALFNQGAHTVICLPIRTAHSFRNLARWNFWVFSKKAHHAKLCLFLTLCSVARHAKSSPQQGYRMKPHCGGPLKATEDQNEHHTWGSSILSSTAYMGGRCKADQTRNFSVAFANDSLSYWFLWK